MFDSGLGGLTVLAEIRRLRPDVEIVYVADDAAFPYGRLGDVELVARVETVMARVIPDHRPDIVVVACSTASTLALPRLRAAYPQPFVGVVPAIKPAAKASRSGLISVLATRGTVARDYTHALVRDHAADCEVTLVGSAALAPIAERAMRGEAVDDAEIAREIAPCFVERAGRRTDHVVLACTHFPLLHRRARAARALAGRLRRSGAGDRATARFAARARAGSRRRPARRRPRFHQRRGAATGPAKGLASVRIGVYPHGGDQPGAGLTGVGGAESMMSTRSRPLHERAPVDHSERPAPMRTSVGQPVRLVDYRVPDFLIDAVDLDISLDRNATRVVSTLSIRPNPAGRADVGALARRRRARFRVGRTRRRAAGARDLSSEPLPIRAPKPPRRPFKLRIETRLDPAANTKLMGLYRSGSAYCTQCEAEGFRRIAYFLDRPDVLSTYRVRLEADRAEAPVLLSNGNLESAGQSEAAAATGPSGATRTGSRAISSRWSRAIWPTFPTRSSPLRGATSRLAIYVEPGREERAHYAMDALKRAMAWDEQVYGREYDLDVFNIVAVSDFNMGAMENKGLNIFNDKYVLASQQTATDDDYAGIEGVIAHEYFHNWTGNRVTCRDWFQLCLKEGLTVFRDQEFSADMRSAAGEADRRGAGAAVGAVSRGRRAARAQRAAGGLQRDQQLLHRDGLPEGRRGHPDAQATDRRRRLPRRHGPVFPALRRLRGHRRGLHRLLRRRFGARPRTVHALVRAGRHAESDCAHRLRRCGEDLPRRHRPDARADAGTADQGRR